MAKDILHVVPHEQAWAVKREGNDRVSSTHDTQKDAIESARELAKEWDDIIIHRPDGTIRERVTYVGTHENGGTSNGGARTSTGTGSGVELRDLVGVGSRVSWGAVLAGAVVSLTTYFTLSLLALAIGLSTIDRMSDRTAAVTAAGVSALIMLFSMFLGGVVASRTTAGEQRREAAVYGILVWGATFLLLATWGFGAVRAGARVVGDSPVSADQLKQDLNLSDSQAQKYATIIGQTRGVVSLDDAKLAAWLTFAGVALSLMSAIAGGVVGAGPEFEIGRVRDGRAVIVAPSPA